MDLNDDVLGLVFERVDSHVSLVRAAAVCRRWRRAIADDAFLRRFRSLHAPAVAGDYYNSVWPRAGPVVGPVFVPSSPPMVEARHFSLDFLPGGAEVWTVSDSHGSLLLMTTRPCCPEILLVCEPLTRRYRKIPLLPPDFDSGWHHVAAYLIDGAGADVAGGCVGMSNFRVVCKLYRRLGLALRVVVFCASSNAEADSSWSERAIDHIKEMKQLGTTRAGGSLYLCAQGKKLIIIDGCTGEFSSSQVPMVEDLDPGFNIRVTDGCDGEPRVLLLKKGGVMEVFKRLNGEWALEKEVNLLEMACVLRLPRCQYMVSKAFRIVARGARFITLQPKFGEPPLLSVDLATIEAAPAEAECMEDMYRCELPWPPALHACLDR